MKLKIQVKMLADIDKPTITPNGDFIDLRAARDTIVGEKPVCYIPLGVAMKLPKGCYAELVPRSSTPKNFFVWSPISIGIIDGAFSGDNDQWHFPATPIGTPSTIIMKNDRICQFSLKLSQHATMWQKLRWLFSSGVELVFVDSLGNENRGGFGTSGKQ